MKLNIYFKYIKQVIVHRWHVALECWKFGLWFAPFLHDNSKLGPTEFFAYANYFMGDKAAWKEKFDYAWNHHWKNNPHHGMYWVVEMKKVNPENAELYSNTITYQSARCQVLKMPLRYAVEMYCDWVAAGKAYTGSNDIKEWYLKNEATMMLHPATKAFINELIFGCKNDLERKWMIKHYRKGTYGY